MALIRDYEIPGTGVVIPNAYHVVTKVDVEKRTHNVALPVDNSTSNKITEGAYVGPEVYWKAGYIGKIAVTVWKDAATREANLRPLGFLGVNPTDNALGAAIGTEGMDHHCRFFIDIHSDDNEITQAYKHLKTTDYYKDAAEV